MKKLKHLLTGFRLRCGDYRVFFDQKDETPLTLQNVPDLGEVTVEPLLTTSSGADLLRGDGHREYGSIRPAACLLSPCHSRRGGPLTPKPEAI